MATQTTITGTIAPCSQAFQFERVSVASDGTEANSGSLNPAISANGRYVTYASDASNLVPDDATSRREE
jgi:hypothetical protein